MVGRRSPGGVVVWRGGRELLQLPVTNHPEPKVRLLLVLDEELCCGRYLPWQLPEPNDQSGKVCMIEGRAPKPAFRILRAAPVRGITTGQVLKSAEPSSRHVVSPARIFRQPVIEQNECVLICDVAGHEHIADPAHAVIVAPSMRWRDVSRTRSAA
jgi:hypothetical protein